MSNASALWVASVGYAEHVTFRAVDAGDMSEHEWIAQDKRLREILINTAAEDHAGLVAKARAVLAEFAEHPSPDEDFVLAASVCRDVVNLLFSRPPDEQKKTAPGRTPGAVLKFARGQKISPHPRCRNE